jgi:fructokinase
MKSQVLCLGEILFDYLADVAGKSFSEVNSWTAYPGGAPANTACHLANLGTPTAFLGCIGNDPSGQQLLKFLQSYHVNTSGVQIHPSDPTRKVYVTRGTTGERVFAGFGSIPSNQFADAFLDGSKLPEELFVDAEFLVLGTLGLAYPETRAAIFQALQWAEQYYLKVVVDLNWRPLFWSNPEEAFPLIEKLLTYTDFLKMSAEEAQYFFQTTNPKVITTQLDSMEGVIITNGEKEVSFCINDYEGIVKPPQVKVIDTTGAGDSFLAAVIHQLAVRGIKVLSYPDSIKEIITYACDLGSLTTTHFGAVKMKHQPWTPEHN